MNWVAPQPTGVPGLAVMGLGFALFVGALILTRSRSGGVRVGEKRSRRSIFGVLIQMFGFASVGMGPIAATLRPGAPLAIGEAAAVLVLMALAIGLFVAAARAMGPNWSIVARTREDHELVTSGPFAAIRHPIYTALFVFMLAMALAFGHWRGLLLGVPLYWLGTALRVAEEEKLLRAQFGTAYEAYAARVRRFVPGLV